MVLSHLVAVVHSHLVTAVHKRPVLMDSRQRLLRHFCP
jgi:hypothetical protein